MAWRARLTLSGSAPSSELATAVRLRMPAVSIRVKRLPSGVVSSVSMASLVVPLIALTIDLSSPTCISIVLHCWSPDIQGKLYACPMLCKKLGAK